MVMIHSRAPEPASGLASGAHDHAAAVPRHLAPRVHRGRSWLVRVHQSPGLSTAPQHVRPTRVPARRRRRRPPWPARCPAGTDLPRRTAQPQDVAHRRRHPRNRPSQRLGHHLANRLVEVYSHVAPEIETRLLRGLEQRWHQAHQPQIQQKRRPADNRPHRRPTTAPHTAPAQRTTRRRTIKKAGPQLPTTQRRVRAQIQEANVLPNSSISEHRDEHQGHRAAIIDRIRKALRPGNTP
jgi:hypothetical protein